MPVMDEFREEREALKNADLKTKWQYFLDYYKWYVIGGAAGLAFVISLIYSAVTAKDSALSGYLLNIYAETEAVDAFEASAAEAIGIDLNEYEVMFDSTLQFTSGSTDENSYTSSQKLMVTIAARETDFVAADEQAFLHFADTETFFDLREIISEEKLTALEDYIYYVDMDVIREKNAVVDSGDLELMEQYTIPVYDHFMPEEMGDPVPIALCIQDSPQIPDNIYFREGPIPMGVVVNTQRLDAALSLIDYLFADILAEN